MKIDSNLIEYLYYIKILNYLLKEKSISEEVYKKVKVRLEKRYIGI